MGHVGGVVSHGGEQSMCTHWKNWINQSGCSATFSIRSRQFQAYNLLRLLCLAWCWVFLHCGMSQTATGEPAPIARLPCPAHHLSDACISVSEDLTWTSIAETSSCAMKVVGSSEADTVSCRCFSAYTLLASTLSASSSLCTTRRFPSGLALPHLPPDSLQAPLLLLGGSPPLGPPPGEPMYLRPFSRCSRLCPCLRFRTHSGCCWYGICTARSSVRTHRTACLPSAHQSATCEPLSHHGRTVTCCVLYSLKR